MARSRTGESVVSRAVRIFEAFTPEEPVLQVSEIARRRTGLHLATASRLVAELVGHGLLAREPDRRVRVGVRLWELALRASPTSRLRDTAMPFMEDVHAVVGHHVQLGVLSAVVADVGSPWLGLLDAILLGAAYGIAMVSGLLEIQRITAPNGVADLAGLTGVYYAAAYAGFLLPSALATVAGIAPHTTLLSVVALITLGSTAAVLVSSRAHLPLPEPVGSAVR